ncbi:MAG: hypothetical protein ACRDMH_00305 [Solirubrobacterales bacterium]
MTPPLAFTPSEAAQALGLSANAFDAELAGQINWIELDGKEVVTTAELQRVLADRSRGADEMRTKATDAETKELERRGFKRMEYAGLSDAPESTLFTKYGRTYDRREAIEAAEAGE